STRRSRPTTRARSAGRGTRAARAPTTSSAACGCSTPARRGRPSRRTSGSASAGRPCWSGSGTWTRRPGCGSPGWTRRGSAGCGGVCGSVGREVAGEVEGHEGAVRVDHVAAERSARGEPVPRVQAAGGGEVVLGAGLEAHAAVAATSGLGEGRGQDGGGDAASARRGGGPHGLDLAVRAGPVRAGPVRAGPVLAGELAEGAAAEQGAVGFAGGPEGDGGGEQGGVVQGVHALGGRG